MKAAVIEFPGSNCDHDVHHVLNEVAGIPADYVWHGDTSLAGYDAVVLPGGFSYGDYLRCGAIARFSPIMPEVERFAAEGRPVLGICNGFQVLTECHILPGALLRNRKLKFLCRDVHLRVERSGSLYSKKYRTGQVLRIPIAHMDGNYFCDAATLEELEKGRRIVFRYVRPDGTRDDGDDASNPNGSLASVAGIMNKEGNVLGMMPHPERLSEAALGGTDGKKLFQALRKFLEGRA